MTYEPPLTLDHNGQIPVQLKTQPDGKFEIVVDLSKLTSRHLLGKSGHLRNGGLDARIDNKEFNSNVTFNRSDKTLHLTVDAPPVSKSLSLTIYGEPAVIWSRSNAGDWIVNPATTRSRLTANELRILGTSEVRPRNIPYNRARYAGYDPERHAPITDLHTHSTSQITASEFMQIGLKHEIDYPVELLDQLGIVLSDDERRHIRADGQGLSFDPTKREGLACEQGNGATYEVIPLSQLTKEHRDTIKAHMHVPQDATLCFSDFDPLMYRYLNPFSKNPALARDMIFKIGEDYAKNGIRYAELSTGAMLLTNKQGKAEWFREMVDAVDQVERKHGVRLRFLVGIPRDKKPHEVLESLEKIKYAARHPYIAGVDILGYENSKARDLSWAMEHITDWARNSGGTDLRAEDGWDFKRDFLVRTHAGETSKNEGNVAESVNIAERSGIRVRVAHAVHELASDKLDQKIRRLSSRDHGSLGFEFCPVSNIAYNNIVTQDGVPFKRWIKNCSNWFLGSDGAGSMQSTPTQLALAALAGGLTLNDLEHLRRNEEAYIAEEKTRNAAKTEAFKKLYGADIATANQAFLDGFEEHLAHVKSLTDIKTMDPLRPQLPKQYDGKIPILVAGAGGKSWEKMDAPTQAQATQAVRLLVAALDPQQVHFVCGRTKEEGVTKVLDAAVGLHNGGNPQSRFSMLALNTADTTDIAHAIDWLVPQPGGKDKVAINTTAFMENSAEQGVSVFIGGGGTTGDMIAQTMRSEKAKYLMMENAPDASKSYADKVQDHRKFSDGFTLVQRLAETLQELYPDRVLFREGVDPFDRASLQALEQKMLLDNTPIPVVRDRNLLPPPIPVEHAKGA